MNNDLAADREIARNLPRAWPAFFEHYGRLTNVQRVVIPKVLEEANLLVSSATASGKTEAVCAPLVEKNIDTAGSWTILYISPTRALVNDLFERLQKPVNSLGLTILRRTGDHACNLNSIPNILITTPESFDSMMCRGRIKDSIYGHVLARVNTVVLDEIHLLHGTQRGEQIKWLMERLRRMKEQAFKQRWCNSNKIQTLGLSATVIDADNVVKEYMIDGEAVFIPGDREIEIVNDEIHNVEKSLLNYLNNKKTSEKILVFSNTRKRVDELAYSIKKATERLGYQIVAHHGSLSKKMREEAEETLKKYDKVIAIATSTLEIGIDVGDIDLVVLDGPANDISGLLQRIGRGNRRTNKTRVMLCGNDVFEKLIQKSMIQSAMNGCIGNAISFANYSVVFQQIASYIFQFPNRSRPRSQVESLVNIFFNPKHTKEIIDKMLQNEEIIEDKSGLRLGEYWMNATTTGLIHSNIDSPIGYNIIDEDSGEKIASGIRNTLGTGLKTGVKLLQKRSFEDYNIGVKTVKNEESAKGQWSYVGKKSFKSSSQVDSIRKYFDIEDDVWPIICLRRETYVFHLGGTARQTIIEALISNNISDKNILATNERFIKCNYIIQDKPDWFNHLYYSSFEIIINNNIEWFERKLSRPIKNMDLPIDLRIEEIKKWLKLERELYFIKHSKWTSQISKTALEGLRLLCD